MYKQKTRKAVSKRFRKTGTGKIKRAHAGTGHLLTNKSRKQKRRLGKGTLVAKSFEKAIRNSLGKS
jgi:large subunit ribosomal protein L35